MEKFDALYRIIWMSRPLMQAAEATVETALRDTDLTVRMRAVLEILLQFGDLAVPDIALRLEIKRQYVQVMVNETLDAGLTKKLPNPRHKRSVLISLTERGHTLIEEVVAQEKRLAMSLAQGFEEEDILNALQVVERLTERLKQVAEGEDG
ncbi:hypothetical protein NBRC116594_37280 [Shimia sp. NS0008-38b]|uniref:MarR family winged helix-turn-helix transcriptional regulator n=1 Tax=Shimia sp. NS0008-38b TaxID=3127653 RepID=UPI00310C2D27